MDLKTLFDAVFALIKKRSRKIIAARRQKKTAEESAVFLILSEIIFGRSMFQADLQKDYYRRFL